MNKKINPIIRNLLRFTDALLWMIFLMLAMGGIQIREILYFSFPGDMIHIASILLLTGLFIHPPYPQYSFIKSAQQWMQWCVSKKTPLSAGAVIQILGIATIFIFTFFAPLLQHWHFDTHLFDFGIYDNSIYNASVTGKYTSGLLLNRYGEPMEFVPYEHLDLGISIFAFIYKFFPVSEILLIAQSLATLLALVPIFKISQEILKNKIHIFIPVLFYFFYDNVHRVNLWEFHGAAFITLFFLWGFYFLIKNRTYLAILFFVLSSIWRADAWLNFAGVMLFQAIRSGQYYRYGTLAVLATAVLPFHTAYFNLVNNFSDRYGYLGGNITEGVKTLLNRPFYVLKTVFSGAQLEFLTTLFLRTSGGIFLLGGWTVLAVLPMLAEISLSQSPMLTWFNHYIGNLTGPIVVAMIYGWKRLYLWIESWKPGWGHKVIWATLAIAAIDLGIWEPGIARRYLIVKDNVACLKGLVKDIPLSPPLVAVDPFIAQLSKRLWIQPPRSNRDQTEAEWMISDSEDHLHTIGLKGNYSKGNWVVLRRDCGYYIAKRSPQT